MHARDVMTSPAICVREDTPLTEIVDLMLKNRISAVPVVNDAGALLGIVSEGDLMRRKDLGVPPERSWWLRALGGKAMLAEDFVKAHATQASELMTRDVVAVGEDTRLPDIARHLEHYRIKRVPVVSGGRVVGIVSRANLLQALSLDLAEAPPHPNTSDREIRQQILDTLAGEDWADTAHLNLVVQDGTVYLWGEVASTSHARAMITAAREVDGVKDVIDNTRTTQVLY